MEAAQKAGFLINAHPMMKIMEPVGAAVTTSFIELKISTQQESVGITLVSLASMKRSKKIGTVISNITPRTADFNIGS